MSFASQTALRVLGAKHVSNPNLIYIYYDVSGTYVSSHELFYSGAPGTNFTMSASVGDVEGTSTAMEVPVAQATEVRHVILIDREVRVNSGQVRALWHPAFRCWSHICCFMGALSVPRCVLPYT